MMNKNKIRRTVLTAIFTAMIAAGSYAVIPVGPVPITLTTLFVLLSGLLGGFRIGLYSTAAYLLLGLIGLPVFAGAAGGFAVLTGPTGGYLVGYVLTASVAGLLNRPPVIAGMKARMVFALIAALTGAVLIYLPGLSWLKWTTGMEWDRTLQAGMYPFIIGDILKTAAAVALAVSLKERFRDFLKAE